MTQKFQSRVSELWVRKLLPALVCLVGSGNVGAAVLECSYPERSFTDGSVAFATVIIYDTDADKPAWTVSDNTFSRTWVEKSKGKPDETHAATISRHSGAVTAQVEIDGRKWVVVGTCKAVQKSERKF